MLKDPEIQEFDQEIIRPDRWQRLKDIFHAAVPMNGSERLVFLNEACADDEELRRDVESLLNAGTTEHDFLHSSAAALVMQVLANEELRGSEMSLDPELISTLRDEIIDDRYEIKRELGRGNIGVVYLAYDRRTNKQVAVKLLLEKTLNSEGAMRIFKREVEALARMGEHPGIAGISDVGGLEIDQPYFVMQYVEGMTLRKALDAKPKGLYLERVVEILDQIAEALGTAHDHGIFHRDLKPENIMLTFLRGGREHVTVIDFGVAKVLDSEVVKSTIGPILVGTPRYMSPEQLRRERATATSDIYALGIIAYEMLMGWHPFKKADSFEQLLELQQAGVQVKPSAWRQGLSEEVDLVIDKALAYDPSKRYQSAREFSNDLERAMGKAQHKTRASRSHKIWLIAAALVIVVLGVVWWVRRVPLKPISPDPTLQRSPLAGTRPERSLTYWLTILRQRDGKTIRATGRETFDTGDFFKVNVVPTQAGALYLFNEGVSGNWHLLYPTRVNNQLNARLDAAQSVETIPYEFTNRSGVEKGTEKIWIVWALEPVPVLDALVQQLKDTDLTIRDPKQQNALRQFMTEHATPPLEASPNKDKLQATLKGRSEVLVYLLELEHGDWK